MLLRHETQRYETVADLNAETLSPTENDQVYIHALKRSFVFDENNSSNADDKYVIVQASEVALTATLSAVVTAVAGAEVKKWNGVAAVSYSPAILLTADVTANTALVLNNTGIEDGDIITLDGGTTNQTVLSHGSENGRWIAGTAANVLTGSVASGDIPNGTSSVVDITVTGAQIGSGVPIITNGDTFPDNVFIDSMTIRAANTLRVVIENQSGDAVSSFSVAVAILEF